MVEINTLFVNFIYFVCIFIFSYCCATNNILSSIFSIFAPFYIIYAILLKCIQEKQCASFTFFSIIKGVSVLIPLIFYANYWLIEKYTSLYKSQLLYIFSFILFINVLEPSIILELTNSNIFSNINGLLLLLLAIYTPKLIYDKDLREIVFEDKHISWGIASSIILTFTYLFNSYYRNMNWRYSGIYSVVIPSLYCLLANSANLWLPLRVYSISLTFLIQYMLPEYDKIATNDLTKQFKWSTSEYDIYKIFGLLFGLISISNVVNNGFENTILESILQFKPF